MKTKIVITTISSLPEDCYECPCWNGEFDEYRALWREIPPRMEGTPKWCPLEEVTVDD